jgi:hypothetical protein
LQPEEAQILKVKYQSPPFGKMKAQDLEIWVDALLLKIHAITGWTIPEKKILTVLVDQFRKKILESYPNCNPDEIEYAFRQTGTTVKDWGKSMNLSLIDEVMIPYLEKRFAISRIEEQKKTKMIENKFDMSDQDLWNQTAILVKKGGYPFQLIPSSLYEWKDKNGQIKASAPEKKEYLDRAILFRHGHIKNEFEKNANNLEKRQNLIDFEIMLSSKLYSQSEHNLIKDLAKKMMIFDMMKKEI